VRTRSALHALAFLLPMRASFHSHRVSCPTVPGDSTSGRVRLSHRRNYSLRLCR
jgi:hypothetical protein